MVLERKRLSLPNMQSSIVLGQHNHLLLSSLSQEQLKETDLRDLREREAEEGQTDTVGRRHGVNKFDVSQ